MPSHGRWILTVPLTALLLASGPASGGPPTGTLHLAGRVVRDDTGVPLASVQIVLPGTAYGTLTDREGRYTLDVPPSALPSRDGRLVATLIGYAPAEAGIPAPAEIAGDSLTIDFRLRPSVIELEALVVTARSGAAGQRRNVLSSRLSKAAVATGATVSRLRPRESLGSPVGTVATPPRAALPASPQPFGPNRYDALSTGSREQYARIVDNTFRTTADRPLSTFSIDVDRASYSNVRRFLLREGRLPPVDAVQIEEMVNYFSYDYDRPEGDAPVAVTTEVGQAPWAPDHRLLRIGLASRPVALDDMPPANLVFLLDVSGSMAAPDKLPWVQSSMRLLVDRLRSEDHVAIVVYAGAAGVVLEPTSGADRSAILRAIESLRAGGSTAGGAGLRLAYRIARERFRPGGNNRVILATDGDFNVGESSDAAMIRLVEEKRDEGTYLTVLGFGTGNLQSAKMQGLAQHGNGNYAYIDGLEEARKVLVSEMAGTLLTVARDVKVQVEFNPARVRSYRLLGYENRLLAPEDFNDDIRDAGELGAGHTVTALYEIVPASVASDGHPAGVDPLRYAGDRKPSLLSALGRFLMRGLRAALRPLGLWADKSGWSDELAFVKVRYKRPSGSASRLLRHPVWDTSERVSGDFTFAAAVAGFGMLLRESDDRGSVSAGQVLELAEDGLGADPEGERHEFLELVRAYETLVGEHDPTARGR